MIISATKLNIALDFLRHSSSRPEAIALDVDRNMISICFTPVREHTNLDYVNVLESFGWVYHTDETLETNIAGVWSLSGSGR
jgi:hypothetical protein